MRKIYLIFLALFLGRANAQYRPMAVGDSLYALGNYTLAINEYAREGSSQAALQIARAYNAMGNFDKAKTAYFNMLEFDSEDPVALYGIGNAYWKLQERDSARTYIEESIAVQKVVLDKEYNALARLAMEENKIKQAIDYYKLAFEEDPTGYLYKYEICILTDQYNKDPKMSLKCYREYQQKFGSLNDYFSEFAAKRISDLNVELHMKGE